MGQAAAYSVEPVKVSFAVGASACTQRWGAIGAWQLHARLRVAVLRIPKAGSVGRAYFYCTSERLLGRAGPVPALMACGRPVGVLQTDAWQLLWFPADGQSQGVLPRCMAWVCVLYTIHYNYNIMILGFGGQYWQGLLAARF
jgi:hypothetical protein